MLAVESSVSVSLHASLGQDAFLNTFSSSETFARIALEGMADARPHQTSGSGNIQPDASDLQRQSSSEVNGYEAPALSTEAHNSASSSDPAGNNGSEPSSSDADTDSDQMVIGRKRKPDRQHPSGKKRMTTFPVIRSADKCGVCHTCLNPQLHKACLTLRNNQSGNSQVELGGPKQNFKKNRIADFKATSSAVQTKKSVPVVSTQQPEEDLLASELKEIVGRDGGVISPQQIQRFERLMEKELRMTARVTLLTVLKLSAEVCLQKFVEGTGLKLLESWLCDARDGNNDKVVLQIMDCLSSLPVELETLKKCPIGQTVGRLRKSSAPEIRESAAKLVDKWKKVVDQSIKSDSSTKQARPEPKTEGLPLKKQKREELVKADKNRDEDGQRISPRPSLELASTPMLKVIDDDDMLKEASAPRIRAATQQPKKTHKLQRLDSSEVEKLDKPGVSKPMISDSRVPSSEAAGSKDTPFLNVNLSVAELQADMDKSESLQAVKESTNFSTSKAAVPGEAASFPNGDRSRPPPEFPFQSAGGQQLLQIDTSSSGRDDKSGIDSKSKLEDVSAVSQRRNGDTHLAQDAVPKTEDDAKTTGAVAVKPEEGNLMKQEESKVIRLGSIQNASVGTGTTRLGSLNTTVFGSNVTRLVGASGSSQSSASQRPNVFTGGSSAPQGAAARAAAAAARAPSPDPAAPKRVKRKRVSWAVDSSLLCVRWFRKDDPPLSVKEDAVLTEDELAEQNAHLLGVPPGFENAARLEHASEREAIALHLAEVDEEKEELVGRLKVMTATVAWVAPIVTMPDATWGVAFGEESKEREIQAAREQRVPCAVYRTPQDSPEEPSFLEPEFDPNQVPLIPLNVPPQHATLGVMEVLGQGNSLLAPGGLAFTTNSGLAMQTVVATAVNQGVPNIQTILAQLPQLPVIGTQANVGQLGIAAGPHGDLHVASFLESGRLRVTGDFVGRGMDVSPRGLSRAVIDPSGFRGGLGAPRGFDMRRRDLPVPDPPPRRDASWPPQEVKGPTGPVSSRLCVFYNSPQGCRNGDNCRFSHISAGNGFDVDAAIQGISRARRRPEEIERERDIERERGRRGYSRRH